MKLLRKTKIFVCLMKAEKARTNEKMMCLRFEPGAGTLNPKPALLIARSTILEKCLKKFKKVLLS